MSFQGCLSRTLTLALVVGCILSAATSADEMILFPCEDVYVVTFGGGEGCNSFIRFDISPLPPDNAVDSVFLDVFVWAVLPQWDGDVDFWNVNSQTWTEGDSARLIWNIPTSDQVSQASGFGQVVGWARSADITSIFLRDYSVTNTYCSVKLKDPDDPTWVIPPGSMPNNSVDTLATGNRVFGQHIYFYPREQVGGPVPQLTVYFSPPGVSPQVPEEDREHSLLLEAYPSPFNRTITIPYFVPAGHGDAETPSPEPHGSGRRKGDVSTYQLINLSVFDVSGRLVTSLVSGVREPGLYTARWDAPNVPCSTYLVRLAVHRACTELRRGEKTRGPGDRTAVRKVVFLK